MTTESSSLDARYAMRLGAIMAIVGGVVFMISNMLHPRSSDIEIYRNQIQAVADSDIWIVDHLGFGIGLLLLSVGLLFLGRAIVGARAQVWVKVAELALYASVGLGVVLIALDGISSKFVHDAFAAASVSETAIALRDAELMEQIDVGLFSMWIIVFFGFTFASYGVALLQSTTFNRYYGWVALVLGAVAVAVGVFQAIDGLSEVVTSYLFVGVASILNLWVIVIGVNMWRRSA
ncbi:MAG: hypothetical protein O7G86_02570 [Gammaproteobacteria bacterium]|nr:hypothetical protein [Gammaproteobacteria bacterium]